MSTITKEFAQDIIKGHGYGVAPSAVEALARIALAAIDSKPVVWVMLEDLTDKDIVSTPAYPDINDAMEMTHGELEPLYRHAQQPVVRPAPECQHQWRCGGANKLQNQRQCIKCGRVELDAQQPIVPATLPCSVELKPGLIIGKGCKTETLLTALRRRADYNADIDAMTPEERAEHDASIKTFKAMLAAAPQEVPDGK